MKKTYMYNHEYMYIYIYTHLYIYITFLPSVQGVLHLPVSAAKGCRRCRPEDLLGVVDDQEASAVAPRFFFIQKVSMLPVI